MNGVEANKQQDSKGTAGNKSRKVVGHVSLHCDILQVRKLQEVVRPVSFIKECLRVGQPQPVLHARTPLHAAKCIVPATDIRHHKPAGSANDRFQRELEQT